MFSFCDLQLKRYIKPFPAAREPSFGIAWITNKRLWIKTIFVYNKPSRKVAAAFSRKSHYVVHYKTL